MGSPSLSFLYILCVCVCILFPCIEKQESKNEFNERKSLLGNFLFIVRFYSENFVTINFRIFNIVKYTVIFYLFTYPPAVQPLKKPQLQQRPAPATHYITQTIICPSAPPHASTKNLNSKMKTTPTHLAHEKKNQG